MRIKTRKHAGTEEGDRENNDDQPEKVHGLELITGHGPPVKLYGWWVVGSGIRSLELEPHPDFDFAG